jgi:hypothetical protein
MASSRSLGPRRSLHSSIIPDLTYGVVSQSVQDADHERMLRGIRHGYAACVADVPTSGVPPAVRAAWSDLRDRLVTTLGDDLVAMWAHGGATVGSDPAHAGDLDVYLILGRRPDESAVPRIEEAHGAAAEAHDVEWDAWYILADDARSSEPPSHAWYEERRDTTWAIHRAHWLAGRYVHLHGAEPRDIVSAPSWSDIRGELDRELEHIERHVLEGDTDPYEATYALLNGTRILHAVATGNVVISKWAAGTWALEQLPGRWHDALRAALRTYTADGTATDAALLAAEMAPFVSFVRDQLPSDRPPDAVPRWSGY